MVTGYVDEAGYDITAKVLDKGNWGENAPGILNEYLDNYLYKIVLE